MNTQFWGKWLLIVALPIIVAVFYITAAAHFSYTPDDTYIYLQFAKNLTHGNGISFNAGTPTYGFTSPLWLFIVSLGGAMGIDLLMVAKVVDLVLASFALIVFYLIAHELIRDVAVAICATIAFSVNAWFMRWAGTGMETSLAVLLMLATMLFCFRNEYFVAIVMAALLSLVRPEAVMIVPIIVADVYVNSFNKRRAINLAGALVLVDEAYCEFNTLDDPDTTYAALSAGAVDFIAKPKGDGKAVPWHTDGAYWRKRLVPMNVITLWLAVDDSTPENGCMRVIPGTHGMDLQELQKKKKQPISKTLRNAKRK